MCMYVHVCLAYLSITNLAQKYRDTLVLYNHAYVDSADPSFLSRQFKDPVMCQPGQNPHFFHLTQTSRI